MNVSDYGLQFIAGWEGLRNHLYDDGGPGRGNATIGVGHLVHYGPIDGRSDEAPFINGLTDEGCYALLREDAQRFVDVVNASAHVSLNQNQFDALVDFCFNTGGGYPNVWNAVNTKGDVAAVLEHTAITPLWAQAALVRRRQAEGMLYNTPEEGMTDDVKAAFAAVLAQQGELGKKVDGLQHLMALSLPLIAAGKTQELADLLKALGG